MIKVKFNTKQFAKDMKNIVNYSTGFLDGIELGKPVFLKNIGLQTIEILKNYVDSTARANPQMLHHVYEWERVGSPEARLFDFEYVVTGVGLTISSSLTQSKTVKSGSSTPFYDKAKIMERGIPVRIVPKRSNVLVFEQNRESRFSAGPIDVQNPGGKETVGSFNNTVDGFFNKYFTQAFLRTSGIGQYLESPVVFKNNLNKGKRNGRSAGISVGYNWISNAGIGVQ